MSEIIMNTSVKSKNYINGELIDDKSLDADYDGNTLDININNNDEEKYISLNNEQLIGLITAPNDNKTLDERLTELFPITTKSSSNSKSKIKPKTKSTRKKNKNSHKSKSSKSKKNKKTKRKR